MFNNQSSTSLEDLTSLSSISSISSYESSIHSESCSTISICNESHLDVNKSLSQFNCDLGNISTSSSCSTVAQSPSLSPSPSPSSSSSLSALINQRLRQKMLSLNIHPENLRKSYKKVTFGCEQRDGHIVDIVRELSEEKSTSRKIPVHNMDTTEVKKVAANQSKKSDRRQSTKSVKTTDPITVNPSDISSVSSIEVGPSTIKQFKLMIEKQKNYLDCLQRELHRLQRMEDVLSELNYKSDLQKRVIDDLSYINCHEGYSADCTCQTPQDDQSHQEFNLKDDAKSSMPNEIVDGLNNNSTVESAVSIVTPTDQTKNSTNLMDNSRSINRTSSKRGTIHSIHAQIDEMINKLHEETVTKHSIGVQTSDSINEPTKSYQQLPITKTKTSAKTKLTPEAKETRDKSVAWAIIIPKEDSIEIPKTRNTRGQAYYLKEDDHRSDMTLQQAFRSRCGHFQARSQARVRQINVASAIRKATAESRLERQLEEFLMRNQLPRRDFDFLTGYGSIKVKEIKPRKMFTEKEMRLQTERLYSDLPEIKRRKEEKRREENVKTHRMMAKNFSQRLKCKAVEGKTTFPLTQRLTND